jgi:hypothetical protein
METAVIRTALHYLAVAAAVVAAFASEATASESTQVAEMPRFLFLVERNESMDRTWSDDPDQPTRWDVVVDAIVDAASSAPAGTRFAVMTSDLDGWQAVTSFDHSDTHLARTLLATHAPFTASRTIASAYDDAVRDYIGGGTPGAADEWARMPLAEPCSAVEVIVLGDGTGDSDDDTPVDASFAGDVNGSCPDGDCEDITEHDMTLLDDAAHYAAHNDLSGTHDGIQTVRTHTVLLDARTLESPLAEDLFVSTAEQGGGLYVRADEPADVAIGISLAMTDAMQSVLNVSAAVTSVTGHRMFRTWTEIPAGDGTAPLHQGHVEAFQLVHDPSDTRYGEIVGSPLWDAGDLLAQRVAAAGATNSYVYDNDGAGAHERTMFTNPPLRGSASPRALVPFDATRADLLGELMLPGYGTVSDGQPCTNPPDWDLDLDCSVDEADARLAIDFLRGVPEATFAGSTDITRVQRGAWKVGGMFLSIPAFSNTQVRTLTDELGMSRYLARLSQHDSVLFVPANDGFLHAFKVPFLDDDGDGWEDRQTDGEGGWELWAYIPQHLLDHNAFFHDDRNSALQLLVDGEAHLNDGSVNLMDVWIDGEPNRLDTDCSSAEADGRVDSDGCEYHRILVASLGLGSRYHYALDVTHPHHPRFLWEWVGDLDGWRKGRGTGTPVLATVHSAASNSDVPVVIASSGAGGTSGEGDDLHERPSWVDPSRWWTQNEGVGSRWYMFDLLDPGDATFSAVGYSVDDSLSPYTQNGADPRYGAWDPTAGLFSTPAAVDFDEDGRVDALYMGTRHGEVIKVLLDNGALDRATMEDISEDSASTCVFHGPAGSADPDDPTDQYAVYYRPSVARDSTGRIRVTWATGWPGNLSEPYESGHLFSVVDGEHPGDEWTCQEASSAACGPHFDPLLLDPGEKVVGPVHTFGGKLLFTTYVADNAEAGPACGVGHARVYALNIDACTGGYEEDRDWGPGGHAVQDSRYVEFEGVPSTLSLANHGIYLNLVLPDGSVEAIGPIRPDPTGHGGDRVAYANWRTVL